jgi:hypothetical protein
VAGADHAQPLTGLAYVRTGACAAFEKPFDDQTVHRALGDISADTVFLGELSTGRQPLTNSPLSREDTGAQCIGYLKVGRLSGHGRLSDRPGWGGQCAFVDIDKLLHQVKAT